MKTILTYYTAICLLCPIVNYESEQVTEQAYANEVAFWCDCGVEMRWQDMMVDLN